MIKIFCRFKHYAFPLLLLSSIVLGILAGLILSPAQVMKLKPLGDIFLNLLFCALVPLIFFNISSSIAKLTDNKEIKQIVLFMLLSFIITSFIAAIYMLIVITQLVPIKAISIPVLTQSTVASQVNLLSEISKIISVPEFASLLSHNEILPLIFFSLLVGFATAGCNENGKAFAIFLQSGANVFMKVIDILMYYAPIAFFAYFAVLVAEIGPQLVASYIDITITYYVSALLYFTMFYSLFAYLINGKRGLKSFWRCILMPAVTSLATCSSAASIPANLSACQKMGLNAEIYETIIPIGSVLHKDGSVLGAIVKITFLFALFGMNFSSYFDFLTAIGIALLVGTVMGAIPSGGMLGEMLIISLYGFPPQTLIVIAVISILIDPLATMLNVTGDVICSMFVNKRIINK